MTPVGRGAAPSPATSRGRRRTAGAALGALLLTGTLGSGCATTGSQRDLDAVQQQLWKVQKDNAALTEQMTALRAEASRSATEASPATLSAADLKLRLEGLDRDLGVLRSRADDSDQRFESLARELRVVRESLEAMARGAAAAPAPQPTGLPASPAGAGATPITPAPGGPAGAGAAGAPGATTPLAAEDLYRQATADAARGNADAALRELQDVIRMSPKGDWADDAQFQIGDIEYGREHYAEAVAAFDALLQGFPASDKLAAAYLKKGLALLALNRTADAVIQLQHLVNRYPKSDEARQARERLRALGLKDR